ncbi:hypothetical protein SAMN00790413_00131 [Deinococcus hopiensis KR-140]|uniref:Uncharacterized protein n=1 Tax=Deinococcus hopiensis KR-140 TaxID=695939 RepID=A0A1W1V664_9DEIO|nr:hypothetical protein SAMN00790413_00131 [Deinococcus hopiensis KR-140]
MIRNLYDRLTVNPPPRTSSHGLTCGAWPAALLKAAWRVGQRAEFFLTEPGERT